MPRRSPVVLLAADTVAECQGMILGKPSDEDHARDMLLRMSGREHRVYTGFEIRLLDGPRVIRTAGEVVVTTLVMKPWVPAQLDDYLDSSAWEGKAGAFGYQDGIDWVRITAAARPTWWGCRWRPSAWYSPNWVYTRTNSRFHCNRGEFTSLLVACLR